MKFNNIIGNPPYQEYQSNGKRMDMSSNLWSKFYYKMFSIETDNLAFITPYAWLTPSKDGRRGEPRLWDIFNKYTTYANIKDVKKHFPTIGSTFGYTITNFNTNEGLKFSDNASTELGFLPLSGIEECLKLLGENNISQFYGNQRNDPKPRVAIPLTRKVTEQSVQILFNDDIPEGSTNVELFRYIYAPAAELQNIKDKIVSAKDILNKHCRWSGFVSKTIIDRIKL